MHHFDVEPGYAPIFEKGNKSMVLLLFWMEEQGVAATTVEKSQTQERRIYEFNVVTIYT
jgi:hypothetical protein